MMRAAAGGGGGASGKWNLIASATLLSPSTSSWLVSGLHGTAVAQSGRKPSSSPTSSIRFEVRHKRSDAKCALKNLLNSGVPKHPFQDSFDKCERRQRAKSRLRQSTKEQQCRKKCWQDGNSDDDSYSYAWFWPGQNNQSSSTGWNGDFHWSNAKKRTWSESDVDEDNVSVDNTRNYRAILGLPPTGSLKLEDIKSAFHAAALKWHPDKHVGPSQGQAEEKFKLCAEAYRTLSAALNPP